MFNNAPFKALSFRDYRLFWTGSFISQMGDQMQVVAVAWQIYELTKSPTQLGLIGLFGFLPVIFFALFGGLIVDHFNRKKLIIICQILLGLISTILIVTNLTNTTTPLIIYFVLAFVATINTVAGPTRQAILPNLVPQKYFMNAVSLNTLQRQAGVVIGPAIAGLLIASYGVTSVYIFNAISFFMMILLILPIKIPHHNLDKKVTFSIQAIKDGINFVRRNPILRSTMMLDFFANLLGSATVIMPIFAIEVLKIGPEGLGLLYAAPAIGGVLVGLGFSLFHITRHQGKIILGGVGLYALATIGFGLSTSLYLSVFFLVLVGAGDMVSNILRNTIRQYITPDYLRGRMVSTNMIFIQGGPKLGDLEAGLAAAAVGGPISVALGGLGSLVIVGLISYFDKDLRTYDRPPAERAAEDK